MKPDIYLANVGANSTHRFLSPVFPDGSFELLTIPETPPAAGPFSVRYRDLRSWNGSARTLDPFIPERLLDSATHYDPEFDSFTYGDNCETAPRAAGLKSVSPGDFIFFIVRMAGWKDGHFTGRTGFYLAGFLEVEEILAAVTRRPNAAAMARFGANAHVRRGLNDPAHWDGFWVFAGSSRSRRFGRAVPVDRPFADGVLRTASGEKFTWGGRSDLQVIGSYTRSCRRIISGASPDAERAEALKQAVHRVNPGALDGAL